MFGSGEMREITIYGETGTSGAINRPDYLQSTHLIYALFNQLQHPIALVNPNDQCFFQNTPFENLDTRIKLMTADFLNTPITEGGNTVLQALRASEIRTPSIYEFTQTDMSFKLSVSPFPDSWGQINALIDIEDMTDTMLRERLQNTIVGIDTEKETLRENNERAAERTSMAAHIFAHDIRNPLAVMDGNAQLLERAFASGRLKKADRNRYLEAIRSGAKRINGLISEGLEDIKEAVEELKPTSVSVGSFLQSVKYDPENISLMDTYDVKMDVVLPDQARQILIYKGRFLKLFRTLLLNSYQAGASEISVWSELGDTKTIIYIQDNGKGMPDEVRMQCMDPFFTTKKGGDFEGTGLGLFNVSRGVKECGGKLDVDWTKVGEGTRFAISLPLV